MCCELSEDLDLTSNAGALLPAPFQDQLFMINYQNVQGLMAKLYQIIFDRTLNLSRNAYSSSGFYHPDKLRLKQVCIVSRYPCTTYPINVS